MHDDSAGLLDLADPSQLQTITEAGGNIAAGGIGGQIAGGNARQKKEDQKAAGEDEQHERGSDGEQAVRHLAVRRGRAGVVRDGGRLGDRVAHFHEHEGDDGDHQKTGEGEEEGAAHSKDGGGQHHEEGKNREQVMIARALQGEEAGDDQKQNQVDGCGEKTAGDEKIVGEVHHDVNQGEISCPAFADDELAARGKLIAANEQRQADQKYGRKIEVAGGGEHSEPGEHKEKERNIKIALDGPGHGDAAGANGAGFYGELRHADSIVRESGAKVKCLR